MHNELRSRGQLVLLAVCFEGGLAVAACVLGWLLGKPPWAGWRWDIGDAGLAGAASLPLLLIFFLCLRWPLGPLARIKEFSQDFVRPMFTPCTWFDLAGISVLAGLGEEMFFRGLCQRVLQGWLGPWASLAAASVLFGLMHLITPTYAVLATLMGGYLGWLWLTTGNLLVAVLVHALYDCVALLYLVKGPLPREKSMGSAQQPGEPG